MARSPLRFTAFAPVAAHVFLLLFTNVLVMKLNNQLHLSWWWIFLPVWLFHGVTARCKCSMPAPNTPYDRQWSPSHAVVFVPLLLCFEVLLCCYLAAVEDHERPPMTLEVVFLPLVLLQALVLADNFRMCMVLMPGEDDNMTDEALWETLPHFAVAVSMVFFIAATVFSILKLSGHVDVLDWWDLLVNFCIGEFFAFLLCVKWVNPHLPVRQTSPPRNSTTSRSNTSPLLGSQSTAPSENSGEGGDTTVRPSPIEESTVDSNDANSDDEGSEFACGTSEVGGHFLKTGLVVFQVLLCMRLEGEPLWAKNMSLWFLFTPMLVMQGAALISAITQLLEAVLLAYSSDLGCQMAVLIGEYDPCAFLTRGMRLAGWWSMDDESKDDRRAMNSTLFPGYNTFEPTPPQHVKKMRKGELCEEVIRLQAALVDQAESSKSQRQELDRIQQEKVLCRVCFERDISIVLMPCRHRILCNFCADKIKHCPICRRSIQDRMSVYDV